MRKKKKTREEAWKEFFKLAGIGKGPKGLSFNHDNYLADSEWDG